MVILFWISLAFLGYSFAGYPLLLWIVSRWRSQPHRRAPILPSVSLIIVARNEGQRIGGKIKNCLELDYPRDKVEFIVASDRSEDTTVEVVRSFAASGIKLIDTVHTRGKHHAQMIARDESKNEILVFTDVSVRLAPDALRKIVSNFADPVVGCVSSEDRIDVGERQASGEGSYVQMEMRLRRLESRVASLVGASGSFFAVRRELSSDWHPDQSSDFFLPLHAVARGFRVVMDPDCHGYFSIVRSHKGEFRRKVRTIVHGLYVFFTHLGLANPFRYGLFSWELVSHKLFRWLAPFAILTLFISNLFLWNLGFVYRSSLVLQVALYLAASFGLTRIQPAGSKLARLASFLVLGNAATVVAWLEFWSGRRYADWQPSRRG